MIDTVLAVDIGTTSLKSGLITERGEVVSLYTYRLQNPCDRFIANEWLFGFNICVRRLMERVDKDQPAHIVAVAISGNGPTVVLPNGITVRWNEKTPEYELSTPAASHSLFLPKLLALKNLFASDFEKADKVFSGPEYLIYQLTGNPVTVLPESRFVSAYWNEDILKGTGIPLSKLPSFIGIDNMCGQISHEQIVSMKLGKFLDNNTPVFSAGPDFIAALIGTHNLSEGEICDRSGSSEGFNYAVPRQIFHEGVRTLPSVMPDLWNVSVLTPNSSKLSEEKRLARVEESVSKLRLIAKENNLDFPEAIVVTGGQAKSKEYMTKKAKLLKMKLVVPNCADAELMGDACCAWMGLGSYSNLRQAAGSMFLVSLVYDGCDENI